MDVPPPILPDDPTQPRRDDRLGSWKAISAYLKRDVSTVQRWEKHEGMPVHRHLHAKRGSVYAYRAELDAWWASRGVRVEEGRATAAPDPPSASTSTRWPIRPLAVAAAAVVLIGVVAAVAWFSGSDRDGETSPLADAEFSTLVEFDRIEQAAAISRDGRFAAFLSDRDGTWDVWVTQVGSGDVRNLTLGRIGALLNDEIKSLGFSPDGTFVTFWVKSQAAGSTGAIGIWAVPAVGGELRRYLPGAAELDWSSDGSRVVYHTPEAGDPIFVADSLRESGRQIHVSPPGIHNHFPTWSPDDEYIYFVRGVPPEKTDVWRIKANGADLERMTWHDSRVSHPTFVDRRTLLYLATAPDDSGPWVHALDVERRASRRIAIGVDRYTSLAASAGGDRLLVTVARPKSGLWRMPISDTMTGPSAARRIAVPTSHARSPRYGPDFLVYVSSKGGQDVLSKLTADGDVVELWSASRARLPDGPAISPDGRHIAFAVERGGRSTLHVTTSDGGRTRALAESLDVRGAPAWSPDGRSITVAAESDGVPRLYNVSLDGRSMLRFVDAYSTDATWSPDGRFVVYSDEEVGPSFAVRAVTATGAPYDLPSVTLSRGARRLCFLPGATALLVLRGEVGQRDLWRVDLDTGAARPLTRFGQDFVVRDFDVAPEGREVVFDRHVVDADILLIDRRRQ